MINNDKGINYLHNPQIAGMMPGDPNIEFVGVRKTKQVIWLQNGCSHYFTDLPVQYFNLLKSAYNKDHKAKRFLESVTNDLSRQIELYTYYVYGQVDTTPDIQNGKLGMSENFRDTKNCPSLLWESKNINIGSHILTPRQLVIIDLIAKDLPDKAISQILGISIKTLDTHKSNLFRAVGVNTKVALMRLAVVYKITA